MDWAPLIQSQANNDVLRKHVSSYYTLCIRAKCIDRLSHAVNSAIIARALTYGFRITDTIPPGYRSDDADDSMAISNVGSPNNSKRKDLHASLKLGPP